MIKLKLPGRTTAYTSPAKPLDSFGTSLSILYCIVNRHAGMLTQTVLTHKRSA